MTAKRFFNKGQSLLEIIVALGIVALILVSMISAITMSMANTQYAQNKTQATKYAQEAIEWLRGQRNSIGWQDLYNKSGYTYCLDSLPAAFPTSGTCGATNIPGTIFIREMTLTGTGGDKITAIVNVNWTQGARQAKVDFSTELTKW